MRTFEALKFALAKLPVTPQRFESGAPRRDKRGDERDRAHRVGRALHLAYGPSGGEAQDGCAGRPEPVGWPGDVAVISRKELFGRPRWKNAFASQHKDRRYYELVEDTLHPEFEYLYFAVNDRRGETRAIQPFFILDLDILAGLRARFGTLVDAVRRRWPRFMVVRTMMVGCVAGEGHIDGDDEPTRATVGRLLARSIVQHARGRRARLIVLKEFPRRYRAALAPFAESGFVRIPSMPQTQLDVAFDSFEDYFQRALKSDTRRKLLKKFKAAERASIEMSVVADIAPFIDEIYELYSQVYDRSTLQFEHLTKEYFHRLSVSMADRSRFFLWRRDGIIVAFCNCMAYRGTLFIEYLGLDYSVALRLHLYHYVFRDLVRWAIANGYQSIQNGSLNYDPKLHFRHRLDPLDLYVKHTSGILNAALRWALPWLEPTRHDRTLRKFSNYHELWD